MALRILAAALALLCTPAAASPGLFVVSDADTTIYLFGTIHALDDTRWFEGDVRAAFDRSSELVVEAVLPGPTDALPALPRASASLPSLLTRDDRARLRQIAGTRFDRFSPWVAWATLQGGPIGGAGYTSDRGADAVLIQAARERGMPVHGLETVEQQIIILDQIPMPEQLALLDRTLRDPAKDLRDLRVAIQQWSRGDADAAAATFNGAFGPGTYARLTVSRNIAWARWISERLARPGIAFVAVGVAHLGGPDSIQAQLATRGILASRVGPAPSADGGN
jgi:uncharacterized protein YbaP (TraB family)